MKRVASAALMLVLCACGCLSPALCDTIPIRVLLGKRELAASPTPVYDGARVLVPLSVLDPLGAGYTASSHTGSVRVTSALGDGADIPVVDVGGSQMLSLSEVVKLTGGEMIWDEEKRAARLIAHLKSVEFVDNNLRINCSFPVTCSTHMWESRAVIDVGDTRLASEAREVYIGTDLVAKARLGQPEEDRARVVLDLNKNAGFRLASRQPAAQIAIAVGEDIPAPPAPKPAAPEKPENQPYVIGGARVQAIDDDALEITIDTSSRAAVTSSFSIDPSALTLTFDRATLSESLGEVIASHPLLAGIKLAQVSRSPARVRLSLDLTRIVAYDVKVESQSVVLSVRLPSRAGGSLSEKLVVIDPGHGGREKGACSGSTFEKDVNLRIARELAAAFERQGVRTRLTRDGDQVIGLAARSEIALNNGADFFISIHCNSNGSPNSVSGIETYYHMYEPSPRALAFALHQGVCAYTGMCDRKARSDRSLYSSGLAVLRRLAGTGLPGVLVECGYLNHSSDRGRLLNAEYRRKLAEGIVAGLKAYVEGTPIK